MNTQFCKFRTTQAQAEAALKNVENAFDQLKAQVPETAFHGM
jgi:hypothetical protein